MLNESWRKLKSIDDTYESTGVLLFRNMFDINPQSVNLFPFKGEENIYESKVLKKIGVQVMDCIEKSVKDIKSQLSVIEMTSRRHMPKDLDEHYFDIVGKAIIMTIEQVNKGMNDNTRKAWTKIYSIVKLSLKRRQLE